MFDQVHDMDTCALLLALTQFPGGRFTFGGHLERAVSSATKLGAGVAADGQASEEGTLEIDVND